MTRVSRPPSNDGFASWGSKSARIPRPRPSSFQRTLPRPDCLVLDIQLGGMSGLDLQRKLGELGARAPIIFVTAYDSPAMRKDAERAGCSAFFLKPVPTKLLHAAINKAVNPGSHDCQMDPIAAITSHGKKP